METRTSYVDKRAHAQFVLVVGALERRNLVAHHRFKLRRAGNRALDAVAKGRDLAANRLAHAHDGVGGDAFRLGEAQRHFRHRAGDEAHLLRAADHGGDGEEERQEQVFQLEGEREQTWDEQ